MTDARDAASGKGHRDENFPVASFLVAPRHRAIVFAFYRFARAADDIADHPTLEAAAKLGLLERMAQSLTGPEAGADGEALPLRRALAERGMSPEHPLALLSAFRQDVIQRRYATWADLMDYCDRSAAPVGRFVLDVHGEPRTLWPANDALCSALQVLNHIQDCAGDLRTLDRCYLPNDVLRAEGAETAMLRRDEMAPPLRDAINRLLVRTAGLLDQSEHFARRIADFGLAMEVAVIQAIARRLVDKLTVEDVLARHVRLSKPATAGVAAMAVGPAAWAWAASRRERREAMG